MVIKEEKGIKLLGLLMLLTIMFSFSVIAQPPFQSSGNFLEGLTLKFPPIETHQINQNFTFNFHAYNTSNGFLMADGNTSCFLDLYRMSSGQQLLDSLQTTLSGHDFTVLVSGGNFTSNGLYAYTATCNMSALHGFGGGFVTESFEVTTTGEMFDLTAGLTYMFFLLICAGGLLLSFKLIRDNLMSKDELVTSSTWKLKNKNYFLYVMKLLQSKLYMVGAFGIYLFGLVFITILAELMYGLNIVSITQILKYIIVILSWGLIPFTLFWLGFMIISFMVTTTKILRYEFGGVDRNERS